METSAILEAINALPKEQRIFITERVLHTIRKEERKMSLKEAAAFAYNDYKNDSELTEFTRCFDGEDFYGYETR